MENPFIYAHAANLNDDKLSEIFIDNDNSRIIDSNNNIFISGYRGSGKSMLMRYHSFQVQNNKTAPDFKRIGIYVECRNPYFAKTEQYFNGDEFQSSIIPEHILVLNMSLNLIKNLSDIKRNLFTEKDKQLVKEELTYYFDEFELKDNDNVFKTFHRWLNKQLVDLQKELVFYLTQN